MPADIEIRHDNQVVLVTYRGVVTIEEVKHVVKTFTAVCDSACTAVHHIADVSQIVRVPPGVIGLILNPRYNPMRHPRAGLIIIVSPNTLIIQIIRVLAMSSPTTMFRFADSMDDALQQVKPVLV